MDIDFDPPADVGTARSMRIFLPFGKHQARYLRNDRDVARSQHIAEDDLRV